MSNFFVNVITPRLNFSVLQKNYLLLVKLTFMENQENIEPNQPKEETSIFSEHDFSIDIYDKHIRQARNALFVAAGILLINIIILAFTVPEGYGEIWIDFVFWGLFIAGFIALGFWTKKKPYYAIIGGLILYALFIGINAYLDISTIYKGLILKIIIIAVLIKGLTDAKQAQDMQQVN
jgi:hypothetical protein